MSLLTAITIISAGIWPIWFTCSTVAQIRRSIRDRRMRGMDTAKPKRRRKRKEPEREIVEAGSLRSRELVRGYVEQQRRVRLANALAGTWTRKYYL